MKKDMKYVYSDGKAVLPIKLNI